MVQWYGLQRLKIWFRIWLFIKQAFSKLIELVLSILLLSNELYKRYYVQQQESFSIKINNNLTSPLLSVSTKFLSKHCLFVWMSVCMNINNNLNSSLLYVFNNGRGKQCVCSSVNSVYVHQCLCVKCKHNLTLTITIFF